MKELGREKGTRSLFVFDSSEKKVLILGFLWPGKLNLIKSSLNFILMFQVNFEQKIDRDFKLRKNTCKNLFPTTFPSYSRSLSITAPNLILFGPFPTFINNIFTSFVHIHPNNGTFYMQVISQNKDTHEINLLYFLMSQ